MERLTRWEGRDADGPRAVMVKRDWFPENLQEALRKLARYEDEEEARERGDLEDGRSV